MTTNPKGLDRPIIGIENRTAQEVFDIMCDRFRALRSPVHGAKEEDEEIEATWRDLALQFDCHRIEALSLLRDVVAKGVTVDIVCEVQEFLNRAPLSGEEALAKRIAALQPAPASEPEGEEGTWIIRIAEVVQEAGANGMVVGWRSCSGCHETNEGVETGDYPYSAAFGCHPGAGCYECGGLGVVWEYHTEADLRELASPEPAASAPGEAVKPLHGYFARGATKMLNDPEGSWVRRKDYEALAAAGRAG